MEERIIDDEYARGIRLKKTKNGYVDVTDELAENADSETSGAETQAENGENAENAEFEELVDGEEAVFEFPVFETDEDDEDLVGLTPEQAAEVRQRKAEEAAKRKADYERACAEGEKLLKTGSYRAAELAFEKALSLDDEATDASVGYWRAKTSDFTEPDVLIGEYAEAGIESLEYDLGYRATQTIKRDYAEVFRTRVRELTEEEEPLAAKVEEKQANRRVVLTERIKRCTIAFLASAIPTAALLALTIVFGLKNFTTRENTYVLPTVLLGAGFAASFIAFMVCTNKWLNALRMRRANEKLSSTEEGARLLRIREYKELYQILAEDSSAV